MPLRSSGYTVFSRWSSRFPPLGFTSVAAAPAFAAHYRNALFYRFDLVAGLSFRCSARGALIPLHSGSNKKTFAFRYRFKLTFFFATFFFLAYCRKNTN